MTPESPLRRSQETRRERSTDCIPDYIEPIEGWRMWIVVALRGRVALRSVFFDQLWTPSAPAIARCPLRAREHHRPWRRPLVHEAPDEACACGIYSASSLDEIATYIDRDVAPALCWAVGRVALWGTVIECKQGWRGSHAYPSRLIVPTLQGNMRPFSGDHVYHRVASALSVYDVPVELLEGSVDELLAASAVP